MGTNWGAFIKEAFRVLKPKGRLMVAEVKSRFEEEAVGGIAGFVNHIKALGFDLKKKVSTIDKQTQTAIQS